MYVRRLTEEELAAIAERADAWTEFPGPWRLRARQANQDRAALLGHVMALQGTLDYERWAVAHGVPAGLIRRSRVEAHS